MPMRAHRLRSRYRNIASRVLLGERHSESGLRLIPGLRFLAHLGTGRPFFSHSLRASLRRRLVVHRS